jgi:hypothetical protein
MVAVGTAEGASMAVAGVTAVAASTAVVAIAAADMAVAGSFKDSP